MAFAYLLGLIMKSAQMPGLSSIEKIPSATCRYPAALFDLAVSLYIRKTSKGLKRAFYPLKPLKLCFKAIKSFKIFKTRISLNFFFISLKIITFSTFFYLLRKLREIKHFDVLLMYPVHLISLCYATHLKVSSSLSFPPTAG